MKIKAPGEMYLKTASKLNDDQKKKNFYAECVAN